MRSDEALHEALIQGDLRAFDALYERHAGPLFGFIRSYHLDAVEAEDLLHEAFLGLLKDRAGVRPAGHLRAWLFGVTRNLCLNRIRSRQREGRAFETLSHSESPPPEPPDHALGAQQDREALSQAVKTLPVELSELFTLRASGLSYEELAHVLGLPLGTVKSRMHQLVKRLREELSP